MNTNERKSKDNARLHDYKHNVGTYVWTSIYVLRKEMREMLFRKSKEKLCDAKRNCATQTLQFADNLVDEMLTYLDQLVATDESNMTPARKSLNRSRIIQQAQRELAIYSSKIKELSTTATKQYR